MKIIKIYWLVDTRPETLVIYPNGYPFYCGLARGRSLKRRLSAHRSESRRRNTRKVAVWVAERDPHIRIDAIESLDQWAPRVDITERLRHWTATLHMFWPNNANLYASGELKLPGGRRKQRKRRSAKKSALRLSEPSEINEWNKQHREPIRPSPRKQRLSEQSEIDEWNKQHRAERKATKPARDAARREAQIALDARRAARDEARRVKEAAGPAREAAREAMFRANSIRMKEEYKEAQRIRRAAAKPPPCPL